MDTSQAKSTGISTFFSSSQPFKDGQDYLDNESGMRVSLQCTTTWTASNTIHFLDTTHDSKLAADVRVSN